MAGVITLLDQPRTLNAQGKPTSAVIFFYRTGTTVLADIYDDADLTIPADNPILLASGEIFPDIYLDPGIIYRRRIVYGDGSIHDVDPLPGVSGSGGMTSVAEFGAKGDGTTDDTAAIQAAIDSNILEIYFPPGTYNHTTLNFNNAYQAFLGFGATLRRTSAGSLLTVSARGVKFWGMTFSGNALAGDNITVTAPEVAFDLCNSTNTQGRALRSYNAGGGVTIVGGVWNTLDLTATGYEFEFKDDVVATTLYGSLTGVATQSTFGGILLDGPSTMFISNSQFGKLTVALGQASFSNNRIIGNVSIQGDSCTFDNNKFAGNITIGDGVGPDFGNIMFGPTNTQAALKTFTISSDVKESAFHLTQLTNVVLVINGLNNDIWHNRIVYTPALVASGGSPALGNGILAGGYSRAGRNLTVDIELVGGSTTNYGSGVFYVTGPTNSGTQAFGSGLVVEAGARVYNVVSQITGADNKIAFYMADTTGAQPAGAIYPFTWAPNANIAKTQITYPYSV